MPWKPKSAAQLLNSKKASQDQYNAKRKAEHGSDPRGTQRWRKLRAMVLAAQPLCADPYDTHRMQGRIEEATQVDHIIPLWDDIEKCFDRDNLQPLCTACHAHKSKLERQG